MTAFIQTLSKLLAISLVKSIAFLMLPADGGISKSAKRGINTVMLFVTVDTVIKLLEGVWNF
ncbi:MAG: hypothetical protein IJF80_02145 [Clostridia bacterium]|nr:hypothetical protein [Clostridia bacterium]